VAWCLASDVRALPELANEGGQLDEEDRNMGLKEWFLRGTEPTKGELRDRYSGMSDADLSAISQDPARYTRDAIARARAELHRRREAEAATSPAGAAINRDVASRPKHGGQGSPRPAPRDASALLRAIVRHTSVVHGDKSQQGRVTQLASMGPEVVPQIEAAIWSVIEHPPEGTSAFENAGLLCEAIGKTHGARAFDILSQFATCKSDVSEYRFVREGAVRGLGHLHDQRAAAVLAAVSEEFGLDSVVSDAYRALGLEKPRGDDAP
jgi:hypothetical protein